MYNPKYVEYRKLGGWLLAIQVITIIMIVYGLFLTISSSTDYTILLERGYVSSGFVIFSVCVSLFMAGTRIICAVLLGKRNTSLPTFYLISHIAIFALNLLNIGIAPSIISAASGGTIFSMILLLGTAIGVYFYFKNSERYRIYTLDEQTYQQELAAYSQQMARPYLGQQPNPMQPQTMYPTQQPMPQNYPPQQVPNAYPYPPQQNMAPPVQPYAAPANQVAPAQTPPSVAPNTEPIPTQEVNNTSAQAPAPTPAPTTATPETAPSQNTTTE